MHIRSFTTADEQAIADLLVETFRPYFEDTLPSLIQDAELIAHQHGDWEVDQRRMARTLHRPDDGKFIAVAVDDQDQPGGLVAWHRGSRPHSAVVEVLAVAPTQRGQGLGRALLDHCFAELKQGGMTFVEVGTGGDKFHAAARQLYESYGLRSIPVTVYLGRI